MRAATGDQPCFSIVLLAAYSLAMQEGLSGDDLFRGTGMDSSVLDDPYSVIGRHQALQFYCNLVDLAPPGFGLDVGLATSFSERGSHGHLLASVDTMETAIVLGKEFYDLIYMHLGWDSWLEGNVYRHRLTEVFPLGPARQFCIDRLLATLQYGADYFSRGTLRPTLVKLDCPTPAYAERYREVFQAPVLFSQDVVEIDYPAEALDFRVDSHDQRVFELMRGLCQELLERLHGRQDTISEVRRVIHIRPGSFPNIEQVAERLGCSPRTLRRRLQQQDNNFQQILDEERESVARDYLLNSELSIQQVGERCGFNDAQNFSQAFRRWTGQTPSRYRKRPPG